jgi:predicted esterase
MRALEARCLAAALGVFALAGPLSHAAADEPDSAPTAAAPSSTANPGPPASPASWCAPELETLANDVCASLPPKEAQGPRTLIIFLHGVIQPDTTWQWAQQRAAARASARHGFTLVAPRGRRGIGPKGMADWFTWPTAATAQKAHEDALIAEWGGARAELEKRAGKPFERVLFFGFSNGAYYGASLAVRDRVKADGYALFAGGSGAKHLRQAGARTKRRAPIYVGWGEKDRDRRDQEKLGKMLRELGWPSKARGRKGVGHAMTDAQVDEAVAFLTGAKSSGRAAP